VSDAEHGGAASDDAPVGEPAHEAGTGRGPTHPVARAGAAGVEVDGHHLRWCPWAPPVLLDARAEAIRQALDGSPLTDLVDALAEVEQRPVHQVRSELDQVVRQLGRHGLLEESPPWSWWSPAALHRPLTACDAEAWNLDRSDVFDLEIAGRRVTVAIDDPVVADGLRDSGRYRVHEPPADLGTAPVELVLATSDQPGGVHRLLGRAGRTFARSTDRAVVVRSLVTHLAALEWAIAPGAHPAPEPTAAPSSAPSPRPLPLVWFDAVALVLPRGGVSLLAGRARYDWARLARPLAAAGINALPGPAVAVDPATRTVVRPPSPDPELVALAHRCGAPPGPGPGAGPGAGQLTDLRVTRLDHVANDVDRAQLQAQGHDPVALGPALAAHRLALLAHPAALDRFASSPPDPDQAHHVLTTVGAVATAPGVASRVHVRTADLVASLRTT
jgi:hypothetical protein